LGTLNGKEFTDCNEILTLLGGGAEYRGAEIIDDFIQERLNKDFQEFQNHKRTRDPYSVHYDVYAPTQKNQILRLKRVSAFLDREGEKEWADHIRLQIEGLKNELN
jgi:hypothetical protein